MSEKIEKTEKIWKEYQKKLYQFIQKRVQNHTIAEDLLQDVFLKIFNKVETLQNEQKLQSWLYQITRNTLLDYFRSHSKEENYENILEVQSHETEETAQQEIAECLKPMIEQLPEPYKKALIRSDFENIPQKEMAQEEGLSLSGMKSRIQRSRTLLQEELLACCRFELDVRGKIIDYEKKQNDCSNC